VISENSLQELRCKFVDIVYSLLTTLLSPLGKILLERTVTITLDGNSHSQGHKTWVTNLQHILGRHETILGTGDDIMRFYYQSCRIWTMLILQSAITRRIGNLTPISSDPPQHADRDSAVFHILHISDILDASHNPVIASVPLQQ
jgi:hypothetical protein